MAPLTENMPSGSAIKPGDVLTTRKRQDHRGAQHRCRGPPGPGRRADPGRRGRARRHHRPGHPDRRGRRGPGQGDRRAARQRRGADRRGARRPATGPASRSGHCPLPDDYRSHIDSEVADMRNMGRPGQAGTIAAAMLLREFVGDGPLGPPGHRRPGPLRREQPLPDQGRHRVRRPDPGGAGHLRGVRPLPGDAGRADRSAAGPRAVAAGGDGCDVRHGVRGRFVR